MSHSKITNSQDACENILNEEIKYNCERNILPSENAVAERLLARRVELAQAYEELHEKLHARPPALNVFLGLVLSTTAFWSPQETERSRAARTDLKKINQQIQKLSAELAGLLDQRAQLHEISSFDSGTLFHPCDVIQVASQPNSLFRSHVQEKLYALQVQYDLKYWPSLGDFLREIATDAGNAAVSPTDPLTAAATASPRSSKADFFKALLAAIDEASCGGNGNLPRTFKLTDRSLACLGNCALNLGPEDLVDEAYLKRLRQRVRHGAR